MPAPRSLAAAALLGLGGGLRSFASPTAIALREGSPFSGRGARRAMLAGALSEVIADKHPRMPSRWSLRGLSPRLAFCAVAGGWVAGREGAGVAAGAAVVSAYAGSRIRVSDAGKQHPLKLALGEDAVSYGLAVAGSAAGAAPGRHGRG